MFRRSLFFALALTSIINLASADGPKKYRSSRIPIQGKEAEIVYKNGQKTKIKKLHQKGRNDLGKINYRDAKAVYLRDNKTGIIIKHKANGRRISSNWFVEKRASFNALNLYHKRSNRAQELLENKLQQIEQTREDLKYAPFQIIIGFDEDADYATIYNTIESINGQIIKELLSNKVYTILLPESVDVVNVSLSLKKIDGIVYAHPNYLLNFKGVIPYGYFDNEDELKSMQLSDAWGIFDLNGDDTIDTDEDSSINDIVIAIIDTGVDYTHEDLEDRIWINPGEDHPPLGVIGPEDFDGVDDDDNGRIDDIRGWDFGFFSDDNDPMDDSDSGHGSHVAGLSTATAYNNKGIAGTAWSAKIMPVKINTMAFALISTAIDGIRYAADEGADVINMSFGYAESSSANLGSNTALEDAVDYAFNEKNCILLGAAGNDDCDTSLDPHLPAGFKNVVCVGGLKGPDYDFRIGDSLCCEKCGSNYGESLDIMAPWSAISTIPTRLLASGQVKMGGTSQATPFVSGVVALMRAAAPNHTSSEIMQLLVPDRSDISRVCDDLGDPDWDNETGWGRINAYKAVKSIIAEITPVTVGHGTITPSENFWVERDYEPACFSADPDNGYEVDYWRVYYSSGPETHYTTDTNFSISSLDEDVSVYVAFKPDGTVPSEIWVSGSTTPDTFEFSMQQDDSQGLLIPIYNPSAASAIVSVSKSGAAASWVSLENISFTLDSHESKQFQVTIDTPDGIASGYHQVNISFNGIIQPLLIRVADLGDPIPAVLSPSSASINGNSTSVDYDFDNYPAGNFDITGNNIQDMKAYYTFSGSQYVTAGDYDLFIMVANLNAQSNNDLIIYMNGHEIGRIRAVDVPIGQPYSGWISGDWGTLNKIVNELSFGLYANPNTNTPLWEMWDNKFIRTDSTTSAYLASSAVNISQTEMDLIDDGYMNSARVYGTVTSCSESGKIYLYNNGEEVDSENIYTSEVGDREYWSLHESELDSSNLFALKGDPTTEPIVNLSNLKLEITFNTNDPVLNVTKQISSDRILLSEQATVTVLIENTAPGSSTGYDTDLQDWLPSGLTKISGSLNKDIGNLEHEDTETNQYTITASQPGHYTLPSARVNYETYDGDPIIDESMPVDLTVIHGQLNVGEPNIIAPHLINESGVILSTSVLDVDGITPVPNASTHAVIEKDFSELLPGLWLEVYTIPMGWSQSNQTYIGITPIIQSGGHYRVRIAAQKVWYDDGQSVEAAFYVHEPDPYLTGESSVSLLDYSILARHWLLDCNGLNNWCNSADINRSGSVGTDDLLTLSNNWLEDRTIPPGGMEWVYINDPEASENTGFTGFMSKYETTNAQYCAFLNAALTSGDIVVGPDNVVYGATGFNDGEDFDGLIYFNTYQSSSYSQISFDGVRFSVRSRDGYDMSMHPVVEVSWYGATAFCNYYGWRLPYIWEWEEVADYDGTYTYACGTVINCGMANFEGCNPLELNEFPFTTPVDYYDINGPAPYGYGLCNMAGNVWEWANLETDASYSGVRGGSWDFSSYYCRIYGVNNWLATKDVPSSSKGFRVCRQIR